ncbi:hypothetical protein BDB00DRAFT_561101 [Zychaea mexicana]|uniref:uncharacterized protein n=1 Tax=Zychaea mexicana TaxID=64656 RepID=UPI0022FE5BB3|nr:uncharacterized protein BDB00DRAFT_561101 [Zychaea mexicana]KAI9490292.1 hypothetical protein BDB00DRAFT_561101 [Zychaea mexicana]
MTFAAADDDISPPPATTSAACDQQHEFVPTSPPPPPFEQPPIKPRLSLNFNRFDNLPSTYVSDASFNVGADDDGNDDDQEKDDPLIMDRNQMVTSPFNLATKDESSEDEWLMHGTGNILEDDNDDSFDGVDKRKSDDSHHAVSPATPKPSSINEPITVDDADDDDYYYDKEPLSNNDASNNNNNDGSTEHPDESLDEPSLSPPAPSPPPPVHPSSPSSLIVPSSTVATVTTTTKHLTSPSSFQQQQKQQHITTININGKSTKQNIHSSSSLSDASSSSFEMINHDEEEPPAEEECSSSQTYKTATTATGLAKNGATGTADDEVTWKSVRGFGPSIPFMADSSQAKGKGRATTSNDIVNRVLRIRMQQEQRCRKEARKRAETERQQALLDQRSQNRNFPERRGYYGSPPPPSSQRGRGRRQTSASSSTSDIDDNDNGEEEEEEDVWVQEHNKSQNQSYHKDHHDGKEILDGVAVGEDDDTEEATRLLLDQLETQDREKHDSEDVVFRAIHDRFKFQSDVDTRQAIHKVAHHMLELKPFEQWNTIRVLDLAHHHIASISNLGTLLPALETLHVSNNAITDMRGLPESLQVLKAKSNRLTSIAGLKDLRNLHYLDVCNNGIASFDDITSLYHLRTLHAEYNKVSSCSPLKRMKDLAYNRIECLESIEGLPSLRSLNLDHNDIKWISIRAPIAKLKVLRMSYNRLKAFDATFFPDLRTLYLDDNQILRIIGLSCIPRISSFSLRDQGGQKVDVNIRYLRGARKIYLSGNMLKELVRMEDFYTLEYLELCSIQLEKLPKEFARDVPNLGVLYLSHNYLQDIRPLRKLRHLQKLVLVDNKLDSESNVIDTVRTLDRLHYLDLRQNPLSAKLYPPIKTIEQSKIASGDISCYLANEYDDTWASRDAYFNQNMDPQWHQRRKCHRALFIKCRPLLQTLDNLRITDEERNTADNIAAELKQKQSLLH